MSTEEEEGRKGGREEGIGEKKEGREGGRRGEEREREAYN